MYSKGKEGVNPTVTPSSAALRTTLFIRENKVCYILPC